MIQDAIVAVIVIINAVALAPELDVARVDLNDSVFHYTIAHRLAERVAAGQSVLDFWMPEWSFGYPVVRDYQPLAHWLVVLAHFGTFAHWPLDTMFVFIRWLLLALFPLSAYIACRWSGMRPATAAAAALLVPLIASPNLYGIEYGSYLWRGNGLFTQLVAMHLFVLAIGAASRAIRNARGLTLAGLLLGLTFLAHFIYGYMAAATIVLIAAMPASAVTLPRRLLRMFWIALVSVVVAAFQIVPMLGDGPFINRSRWEPVWKWDSFGLGQVAGLTATGDLLDAGRLPMLSLLALIGAIAIVRRTRRNDDERFAELFAIAGALLWLFLFCGRAAWGPLFQAIGLSDAAQLHRFIGGAQWFLLLLAAFGLTRIWHYPRATAAVLTAIFLWPPISERAEFLRQDAEWGRINLAAFDSNREALQQTIAMAKSMGGRSYPGLASTWGAQFRVGYVPVYAFLSEAHVPAVAFLYHAMALPADVMVRFDETRPDHYRLFDIRSVITDTARAMPGFLRPVATTGAFRILTSPPSGAFDLVQAPRSIFVDRRTFFDVNDAWLQSTWPAAGAHLLLDYESAIRVRAMPPRLPSLETLKQPQRSASCGAIAQESDGDDVHRATIDVTSADCYALLKMTYHPNWRATIDGAPRDVVMLSPGFAAVRVTPGRHVVELRYVPGHAKTILLLLAMPLLVGAFVAEKRGAVAAVEARVQTTTFRWPHGLLVAALLLPVIAGVAGSAQPNGHDALEYLPRVLEFHENIRSGIFLPRWAPDLSSGQGQPLFLFNPPLFYYLSELFHLLGLSFVASMNAACVLLIAASAATMYRFARWLFGPAGGALAAAAYVYAPYFLVDLYVRTAFAEFSAFPFYPLALYGFARHAAEGRRRHLVVGVLGYAAVWFAHSPAALLFSPLLGAFLLFLAWQKRSWRLLATHIAACVVALLIAACIWVPSLVEAKDTHAQLLTEGPLKYSNHFVFPSQFFSTGWGYGVSIPGDQDGMPFSLGWPQLLLGAIAAFAIARWESEAWKRWLVFFAGAAFILCFLMTQRAHAVWDALPHIQYVAFPWRMLAPVTCCLALLAGAVSLAWPRLPERWRGIAFAACVAAIVLPALQHARPAAYLSIDEAQWTPRQVAAAGVIPATFDTFEPRWVNERPVYRGESPIVTRGAAATRVTLHDPHRWVANVAAQSESDLDLPLAYFPGWHLRLDGVEQRADDVSPMGRMRITVPAGTHAIEATFERTPARWIGDLVTLAALLLVATYAVMGRTRSALR